MNTRIIKKILFFMSLTLMISSSYAFEYEKEFVMENEREHYETAFYNDELYHILAFCSNKSECEKWIVLKEKKFHLYGPSVNILNKTSYAYFEILKHKAYLNTLPEQGFYSQKVINILGLNNNLCNLIDSDKIISDTSILEIEEKGEKLAPKQCFNGQNCKKLIKTISSVGNTAFKIEKSTSPLVIFSASCKGNEIFFVEPSLDYAYLLDSLTENIRNNYFYYNQIEELTYTKKEFNDIINPKFKEDDGLWGNVKTLGKKLLLIFNSIDDFGLNILELNAYFQTRNDLLSKFENVATVNQLKNASNVAKKHLTDSETRISLLTTRNEEIKIKASSEINKFTQNLSWIWLKKVIYENTTDLNLYTTAKKHYNLGIKLEKEYKFNSAFEQFKLANIDIKKALELNYINTERSFSNLGKIIIIFIAGIFILLIIGYLKS